LDFRDTKTLVLQSNHSEYKIEVEAIYVRGHEPPDILMLRGQIFLEDNKQFSFEPFVEGMSADPRELTEDPLGRQTPKLYETLKAQEGKLVSIRFPKEADGTVYGPVEAILEEVTHHYVTLHVPDTVIRLPDWAMPESTGGTFPKTQTVPGFKKSIALGFLQLEEDTVKKRLMLVMAHSNWDRDF
jgi:hypothetical protein